MSTGTQEFFVGPDDDPDKYRLLHQAGDGGEAELWKAVYEVAGGPRPAAVKILRPDHLGDAETWRDRWSKQVEVLRLVPPHPAIVGMHEAFEGPRLHAQGRADPNHRALYLVMNWIEGTNLRDWVVQNPRPEDRLKAQRYLRQIANVLDWLHSGPGEALNGDPVSHCDLTPANVIINGDHQAVLVDWGLVRVARHVTSNVRGTPYYSAPEVWNGEYGPAADRYAFGCLAYYVLTGTHPPVDPKQRHAGLAEIAGVGSEPADVEELERIFADDPDARPPAGEWLRAVRLQTTTASMRGSAMPPLVPGAKPSTPGHPGVRRVTVGLDENGKVVSAEPYRGRRLALIAAATSAVAMAALFLTIGTASAWFRTPDSPSAGDDGTPTQTPSAPSSAPAERSSEASTSPPQEDPTETSLEWTVLHADEALRMPESTWFNDDTRADLDELLVEPGVWEGESDNGTDILWSAGLYMQGYGTRVGLGPDSRPQPEVCVDEARSRPIGQLDWEDMVVGETALCVITTADNVAWLLLVEENDLDLVFEVTVWTKEA